MKKITLTNDFHNTQATVIPQPVTEGRDKGYHKISRKTMLRLRNQLCGLHDCTCGGQFGERGGIRLTLVDEDSEQNIIIDLKR